MSANETISFVINASLDASDRLEIDWPGDFSFPPDLDCGDADVATGTQFYLSNTSTNCVASATRWGVEFISDTRVFRLTAPSTAGMYVATGTQITITIGLNATYQQTGTTQIVNPAATGVYTIAVGGNFAGSGNILVSINAGLAVQATVAEGLTVSLTGVAAGSCTADDGATVTPIDTAASSVPFGNIAQNTFYIGCQDLSISTNAGLGYAATAQEQTKFKTLGGTVIPDTTCDGGTCTESAGAAWTNASINGFGHTCANQTNHDCASAYASGTNFRQFADISSGETAQAFMSSTTPAIATGRVKFRVSRASSQTPGSYLTTITYIVTPTY